MSKTITELLGQLESDVNGLDVVLLGNENDQININGVVKPSITRALKERFEMYRTISTSAPNTIPRDGEEWIVVD